MATQYVRAQQIHRFYPFADPPIRGAAAVRIGRVRPAGVLHSKKSGDSPYPLLRGHVLLLFRHCDCEVTDKVTLFRQPANCSNGNTRDLHGRLITCEHLTRRITRTGHDGSLTVLLDRFDGKCLNAPNDVVVHSDGAIWFTDPGYGISVGYEGERAEAELPRWVYRLDAVTGAATVVADDLVMPNGLCFSPDESLLYISDSGISHDPDAPGHIRVFEVVDGRKLCGGQVFADMAPGFADGMRTDRDGNLWSSVGWAGPGTDGVHCLTPDGELIGRIHLPEPCWNLCFGGVRKNRLFMT